MSRKVIAAVLPDKDRAYDLSHALKALSRDEHHPFLLHSGVTLYINANGTPEVLKERDRPLLGTVSSAPIGGLIGLLSVAQAPLSEAAFSAFRDAFDNAVDRSVIQALMARVKGGEAVIILDADEEDPADVDALIAAHEGSAIRQAAA